MRNFFKLTLATTLFMAPCAAQATTVLDAAGDFAPGYLGAAADLDVRSFTVLYNSVTQIFSLSATMNGVINPATVGVYIIGVNTGTGTNAPFAALGAPNVRFNQTIRVNKDGTAVVGANNLTATISGNAFSIDVAASLFPTTGFAADRYGFNLWPRDGVGAGTFVTDFAPNDGTIAPAPEPATWAMMVLGFGAVGGSLRRRRRGSVRPVHA